jgi:hypothetical protein
MSPTAISLGIEGIEMKVVETREKAVIETTT